jgi:ribokinase
MIDFGYMEQHSEAQPLDFLAIGDIVTEPFIKLSDAEIVCDHGDENCKLCMRYGDKIPYEEAIPMPAVGNASNAAVSAARLGLKSGLRAYVGNDDLGKECLTVLGENNVDTSYMVTEDGKQTNHHFVLWYKTDRTILVKHENYSYRVPTLTASPKWIYLSSLAANSLPYHAALVELLAQHPDTKFTYQPGTFQMAMGVEATKGLYERANLLVVNKEEAERILKLEAGQELKTLLTGLGDLGPKIVAVTDGTKGAYAYDREHEKMYFIPMYPDQAAPFERTGAGDAFASAVTAALAIGKTLEEALLWGPVNSMSVVQQVGAQRGLLTREQLEKYISDAPAAYAVQPLD